jgi:hypothetical protein
MATKASAARGDASLFSDPSCGKTSSNGRSGRTRKRVVTNDVFIDAIHEGKPVHLFVPRKEPLEREIEWRIRVVLTTAGVLVLKHSVEICHTCGTRPRPHTGLGKGTADLFCIVPPMGRVLFIEVKRASTRNAKRDELQRKRAACVRRHGGVSGVATCEAEALALLEEARRQ